jgi:two-component system, NarL family, response regulator NreC
MSAYRPSGKKTVVLLADTPFRRMELFAECLNHDPAFRAVPVDAENRSVPGLIGLHAPDIVLYDFLSHESKDIPLLQDISGLLPGRVKAIAFTDCTDMASIFSFITAGGYGYVLKSAPDEEILLAIRRVQAGVNHFSSILGWKGCRLNCTVV